MIQQRKFVITVEIEPQNITTWHQAIETWIFANTHVYSNITNGQVVQICEFTVDRPIFVGFENNLVARVYISASVFLPQIGKEYTAHYHENIDKSSVYTIPHSKVWIERHTTQPTLQIIPISMRYVGGQFLIVAREPH